MDYKLILDKLKTYSLKILSSPPILSILLCFTVLFFTFVIYKPMYNTCDDAFMRMLADGSFNKYWGLSDYLMYSNYFYGKFLKFFYELSNKVYWYDLFEYLFQLIAMFIISCKLFSSKKENILYNAISLVSLFLIFTPLFLQIQFTTLASTLAIAAIILAITALIDSNKSALSNVINIIAIICLSLFSGLIRFEAFMATFLFGSVIFLFFIRKNNFKKALLTILLAISIVCINFALHDYAERLEKKQPVLKESLIANDNLVKLYNNTIAGNSVFYPWIPVEKSVNNLEGKLLKHNWTVGDYRLLLSWADFGNENINNNDIKKMLIKDLNSDITLTKNISLKFGIQDYNKILEYYYLILFFIFVPLLSRKNLAGLILHFSWFVIIICMLNVFFRDLPYRLWINFANAAIVFYLLWLKNNDAKNLFDSIVSSFDTEKIKLNKKLLIVILSIIYLCTLCLSCYKPIYRIKRFNNKFYKTNKIFNSSLDKLDNNKIYLNSVYLLEIGILPFKKSLFNKNIKLLPYAFTTFAQHKNLVKNYNIPTKDTWNYICSSDNVEILTFERGPYEDFYFNQIRLAVSKHMKDRYNKDITFVKKQDFGHLKSYACQVMSQDDLNLAKQLEKAEHYNYLQNMEKNINNGNF